MQFFISIFKASSLKSPEKQIKSYVDVKSPVVGIRTLHSDNRVAQPLVRHPSDARGVATVRQDAGGHVWPVPGP